MKRAAIIAILVFLASMLYVKLRFGLGAHYPSVQTPALLKLENLSTLVELPYPPGNVTTSHDGRIFFNYHPFAKANRFVKTSLFELRDGTPVAFPSDAFQGKLQGVFGLKADARGRLWLIEPAGLDFENTILSAIDLSTGKEVFSYRFPKGVARFAQDLRITRDGRFAILADTGLFKFTSPGLVVFNVEASTYRILLQDDPSTHPQNWIIQGPLGDHHLGFGLLGFFVGVDGIEISDDEQWLYFAAMTHESLYRVPLAQIVDDKVSEPALKKTIERLGRKPLSDGISLVGKNSVVLTDIEHGGLGIFDLEKRAYQTLVSDPKVIWADGVAALDEHTLLFTDSAIPRYIDQLARPPSSDSLKQGLPYRIMKVRLD